jgi:hypothetical protein
MLAGLSIGVALAQESGPGTAKPWSEWIERYEENVRRMDLQQQRALRDFVREVIVLLSVEPVETAGG